MVRDLRVPPALVLTAGLFLTCLAAAGQANAPRDGTAAVATCVSVDGALLRREDGKPWQPVRAGEQIHAGDLLVALPAADLRSGDGAVDLMLRADVGQRGPYPVLETAVRLGRAAGRDLDVTLDRGIIGLSNRKKEGAARVRVHVAGVAWDVTLVEPGAKAGLEVYSRQPPGLPVLTQGKVGPPTTEVALLVLHGPVQLSTGNHAYHLGPPPGPALVRWDSVAGEAEVRHLDKLPPSILARTGAEEKAYKALCAAAARLDKGPVGPALDELLHSEQKADRLVGVTAAGALDDLGRLLGALADAKHADARDHAVLVLRHWMGRGPGQVGRLHDFMKDKGGYPATRARTVIQLLFGFNEEDRGRADTYALLLDLLGSPSLPARELARWHLVRLAPAGKSIRYDAAAPVAERARAIERWRALVPAGQLPPPGPAAPPEKK